METKNYIQFIKIIKFMELLLADIRPVADDFDKGIAYILSLWKHIKAKPDLKIPFHSV